ncbi:Virulence-associated E [uncultured Caudovirales phage]|uniref:Virulence-associated E n=1 Tax=uncultured Caudovirales phage TaxID=2100421 RepID=A0A6J5RN51_9CAUD|nr:Virulence-associated E [uncultured Caudovirales phage]
MSKRWGALPEDWAHLKRLAKVDLLPVVSNPHLELSPMSRMKGVGKTPSVMNHRNQVIGFKDWTEHQATVVNIEAWAENPDFGICIQTRLIRGFDIDVPDKKLAKRIRLFFLEQLGLADLPRRWRADSGKELLAFKLEGTWSKRSFIVKEWEDPATGKTKRWLVEFLADGQQFVACGTHPEGERYQWDDERPDRFPTISAEDFEAAWDATVEQFALEGTDRRGNRRDPTLIEDLDVDDPVATYLVESPWPTYDYERGMLYLDCPWKDNHSSDNGPTETAWMLAGTGKYRNGHFSCRHAGCTDKSEGEFFKAVGYKLVAAEEFDDLSADDPDIAAYVALAPGSSAKSKELKAERKRELDLPLPGFNRDGNGAIETSLENVTRGLKSHRACGVDLAFDDFRGELMLAETPGAWRSFGDPDAVRLRIELEALGFKHEIGKEKMRDALELVGDDNHFDAAREWLMNVVPKWDGVARIHRFWPDYMQTKDTPYTRELGNYSWTAQAGRILDPGCKVDMVPVLVGEEGTRKSTAISLIAPSEDFFSEFNLSLDDDKLARLMRGCLVGELAELRGISARDGDAVLAWITRRYEKWTPKFKEYAISLARRLVFYGTTNDPEFLQSHMGFRRWLPVIIAAIIDTDRIIADRAQLWAEARDVFLCEGVLFQEVERLAKGELNTFQRIDVWEAPVARWLDQALDADEELTPRNSGTLTAVQVLTECCGLDINRIKKTDEQRIAVVLKRLKMVGIQRKVAGRNTRVWVADYSPEGSATGDRRTREGRS